MASMEPSETKESELQSIIQKLTTSGKRTLDDAEVKKLKDICKLSNKYVDCAYYALMTQLRKNHAEIRYSALLIINELFLRSSVFRSRLETDFDQFMQLVEETDPEQVLPPPVPVAKELRIKGLEFIKNWANKFGKSHYRLHLALNYLKKCRKIDFDDMEARSQVQQAREYIQQKRHEKIIQEKISQVYTEMEGRTKDVESIAVQIENCFRLLVPDDLFAGADSDTDFEEYEGTTINMLRQHGVHDVNKILAIEISDDPRVVIETNEDTQPIIENLLDLEKAIRLIYYPMVVKWTKIISKGLDFHDRLKQAIDLKLLLEAKLEKLKELNIKKPIKVVEGCNNGKDSDEDDDDFEEVMEKVGYEDTVKMPKMLPKEPQPGCSKNMSYMERSYQWKLKHHMDDMKDPTTALSTITKRFKTSDPVVSNAEQKRDSDKKEQECNNKKLEKAPALLSDNDRYSWKVIESEIPKVVSTSDKKEQECKNKKLELLEKAPVLPYDNDLYHWEEEKPLIPEVVRFDSLHKFFEIKDDNEESEKLKEIQVASLRTRKIDFSGKFEPVKWTCRAPLQSGKLCPRSDRYKCPFHGRIIARDGLGNPSGDIGCIPGPSSKNSNQVPDWQDPQLLKDIEAAIGIDLKIPKKGSRNKKEKNGLTNIKQVKNTVRDRLAKKISTRYKHIASKLDEMDKKRFDDKFGDQWNYY